MPVCVSAFYYLGIRHQTKGISGYSVLNTAKHFFLKQLSWTVRSAIKLSRGSQPFSSCTVFRIPFSNLYVMRLQWHEAGAISHIPLCDTYVTRELWCSRRQSCSEAKAINSNLVPGTVLAIMQLTDKLGLEHREGIASRWWIVIPHCLLQEQSS